MSHDKKVAKETHASKIFKKDASFVAKALLIFTKVVICHIDAIKNAKIDRLNNPLKNAPHTLMDLMTWNKSYSPELGCFPMEELKQNKISYNCYI